MQFSAGKPDFLPFNPGGFRVKSGTLFMDDICTETTTTEGSGDLIWLALS